MTHRLDATTPKALRFDGRLVMLGFGCIGQGVLPLLLRHIEMGPGQISVVAADDEGAAVARAQGVALRRVEPITRDSLVPVLGPLLAEGDFLLNLSVDVSSEALIALCQARGALYLDTCAQPWAGGHVDARHPPAQRTNHALREALLALRRPRRDGPTALITHGANPGLVSHLLKQALLDVAQATGGAAAAPAGREGWAQLACDLGVRVIHIAERDTQNATQRKEAGEFVNTWSARAFAGAACQPAELGWGSHERAWPAEARHHGSGSPASIYLLRPGGSTRVRSWVPMTGPQHAFLVSQGESISMADYLTLGPPDRPRYRPTVHCAYRPCDDALLSLHELAARNWRMQHRQRILKDDITTGVDALGVLLMGHARNAYWYGSMLSTEHARALAPCNSATSLQVGSAVMAGVVWALRNPRRDVIEPDELPFEEILSLCRPYLGELVGVFSSWTPLQDRQWLFEEDLDLQDPWQFKNFLVR